MTKFVNQMLARMTDEKRNKLNRWNIETLKRFDLYNRRKSLRDTTRDNQLKILFNFSISVNKTFKKMTRSDINEYFDNLNLKPYTIDQRRIIVTKFFRWYYDKDKPVVIKDLHTNRKAYTKVIDPSSLWSDSDIKQFIKGCTHPRDKALFMTLYDSGARIGELLSMNFRDVEFQGDTCSIFLRNSKTQRRRVGLLFSTPYLQEWLQCHPMRDNPDAPLWISLSYNPKKYGNRLSDNSMFDLIKNIKRRAKMSKPLNPHLLRHSAISKMRKSGMPDALIRRRVGLSPGSVVLERYTHLSDAEVENSYRKSMGYEPKEPVIEDPEILKPRTCLRCSASNPVDAKFCHKCHIMLDYKAVERDLSILEVFKSDFVRKLAGVDVEYLVNQYQQIKVEISDMQSLLDCFNGNDSILIRDVKRHLQLKDQEALDLLQHLETCELIEFSTDTIYLQDKEKFTQFISNQKRYLNGNVV